MNRLDKKQHNRTLRKARIRATVSGNSTRPRLSVHFSNLHVSAQIIDDSKSHTVAYSTSAGQKLATGSLSKKAEWVGADIAIKAIKANIKTIVYDRNGKKYHGRVKILADTARKKGLEF